MTARKIVPTMLFVSTILAVGAGCENKSKTEKFGDKVEDVGEDIGDKAEDVGDSIEDKIDD